LEVDVTQEILDYLIVGAGPAGLQLGQLLGAAGRDYRILEAGDSPGTFFRTFPRHRTLISSNKRYTGSDDAEFNLRMDWNSLLSDDPKLRFTRYSERYFPPADELVRYLSDYADAFKLNVDYGTRVTRIGHGEHFAVSTDQGEHLARRVVMATGVSQPYIPPVPGIEHAERYTTVSVDPQDFVNQRVLILGKGNSAFETADNLLETTAVIHVAGPGSLRMAWKTHYVGHLRAVNNNFLDTYQLKTQNAILDGSVRSIERTGDGFAVRFAFARADEVVKELHYDRVIVATGFRFDASVFAEDCRPALSFHDRFPTQSAAFESVNVPGLYFAGTLMQQRDFKKSTSGFIHGFRYAVRALSRILDERYENRPWPARDIDSTPEGLAEAVIARVNRSSALWQQFGTLADIIVGDQYLEEMPVGYAAVHGFADYVAVTLEYGPDHDKVDPFDITVARIAQDQPGVAHDAAYLHPVLRHFRDGRLVGTHHMAENLENEWNRLEAHRKPLTAFFAASAVESAPRT
jgi:thioredoxin reductase